MKDKIKEATEIMIELIKFIREFNKFCWEIISTIGFLAFIIYQIFK